MKRHYLIKIYIAIALFTTFTSFTQQSTRTLGRITKSLDSRGTFFRSRLPTCSSNLKSSSNQQSMSKRSSTTERPGQSFETTATSSRRSLFDSPEPNFVQYPELKSPLLIRATAKKPYQSSTTLKKSCPRTSTVIKSKPYQLEQKRKFSSSQPQAGIFDFFKDVRNFAEDVRDFAKAMNIVIANNIDKSPEQLKTEIIQELKDKMVSDEEIINKFVYQGMIVLDYIPEAKRDLALKYTPLVLKYTLIPDVDKKAFKLKLLKTILEASMSRPRLYRDTLLDLFRLKELMGTEGKKIENEINKQSQISQAANRGPLIIPQKYTNKNEQELYEMYTKLKDGRYSEEEVFGLSEGLNKKQYYELLQRFHPDRFYENKELKKMATEVTKSLNSLFK